MVGKKRKASEKSTEENVIKQSGLTAVANGGKQDETSFPRGGASVLTPLEHKEISIKAAKDLFSVRTSFILISRNK